VARLLPQAIRNGTPGMLVAIKPQRPDSTVVDASRLSMELAANAGREQVPSVCTCACRVACPGLTSPRKGGRICANADVFRRLVR